MKELKDLNKVIWWMLSINPAAIHLLERNIDKVHWRILSQNPAIFEKDDTSLLRSYV